MAEPETNDATAKPRRRFWWVKWVIGVALLGLLIAEGVYLWPTLHNSWRALTGVHWGWIAACIVAQAASMSSFGRVQQRLLGAAGVRISQRRSLSVIYASTAMSLTLPAGQVFSTAFTYRQTRKWGATPVVASWQVAMSGVLAAAGLAVLGVGGALFVGTSVNPFTVVFSIAGVILLVFAGRYVAAHPDSLEDVGRWALGWYNKVRDKPDDAGVDRWREILHQLEAVQMGRRDTAIAFGWSFYNWVADIACLAFACLAVGAHPGIAGLAIAYAAGKAVGSIPLAPGGLVFVDGTLIAALTAAGMTGAESVAAVLVYRIISFILVAIVGWIIFLLMYRAHQHEDLELDRELRERELHGDRPDSDAPDDTPRRPGQDSDGSADSGTPTSLIQPRPRPQLSD